MKGRIRAMAGMAIPATLLGCAEQGRIAWQQPGTLDRGFASRGLAIDPAEGSARSIERLPDGRILLLETLGNLWDGGDVRVRRLLGDGSADLSFGDSGSVVLDLGAWEFAREIEVQEDGRILALIWSEDAPYGYESVEGRGLVLVALTRDGRGDTAFGQAGSVSFPEAKTIYVNSFSPSPLRVLPSGWILLAYGTGVFPGSLGTTATTSEFVVRRLTPEGAADPSFGAEGQVRHTFPAAWALPAGVEVSGDESILVPGSMLPASGIYAPTVLRAGTMPAGPGAAPSSLHTFGEPEDRVLLATDLDEQGRLVALGESSNGVYLLRWLPDGAIDRTFLSGGTARIPAFYGYALRIAPDGSIYVGGSVLRDPAGVRPCVVRVLDDGSIDESFGESGSALLDVDGEIYGLALDGDGAVIVAGWTWHDLGLRNALVARLWR